MTPALVLAVEADSTILADLQRELRERYSRHYVVGCASSAGEALAVLEERAARGEDVALALAGRDLGDMAGVEFLVRVGTLHPQARRALLVPWGGLGEAATSAEIRDAMARGDIDHYVLRPAAPPDELFHSTVSGFLLDWAEARRRSAHGPRGRGVLVGTGVRAADVLGRCALPHTFHLADSDAGRSILDRVGSARAELPLVLFPNGADDARTPATAEIAPASGTTVEPGRDRVRRRDRRRRPCGLSAASTAHPRASSTLVIDSGGYRRAGDVERADPQLPRVPARPQRRPLAQRAYEQAWIFGARFALMQRVHRALGATARGSCSISRTSARVTRGRSDPGDRRELPSARHRRASRR